VTAAPIRSRFVGEDITRSYWRQRFLPPRLRWIERRPGDGPSDAFSDDLVEQVGHFAAFQQPPQSLGLGLIDRISREIATRIAQNARHWTRTWVPPKCLIDEQPLWFPVPAQGFGSRGTNGTGRDPRPLGSLLGGSVVDAGNHHPRPLGALGNRAIATRRTGERPKAASTALRRKRHHRGGSASRQHKDRPHCQFGRSTRRTPFPSHAGQASVRQLLGSRRIKPRPLHSVHLTAVCRSSVFSMARKSPWMIAMAPWSAQRV
jgi:hypothetical protein